MKRLVSMVLAVTMLLIFVIPASAVEAEDELPFVNEPSSDVAELPASQFKYRDKMFEQYEYLHEENLSEYDEMYYHHDQTGTIDWAIVYVKFDQAVNCVIVCGVLGGRPIYLSGPEYPFTVRYGLYDAEEDRFYDMWNTTLFEKYPDLYDVWQTFDLSAISPEDHLQNPAYVNGDGIFDICDATHIQRYLAFLISKHNIVLEAADVDRDGDITVLDVTRIQRTLALICNLDGTPYSG